MVRPILLAVTLLAAAPIAAANNFVTGLLSDVASDYKHYYYSNPDYEAMAILAGSAGTLANTGLDRGIRKGWRDNIKGSNTKTLSEWGTNIGGAPQVGLFVPLYLGTYWLGAQFSDNKAANLVSQWSNRAFRITALIAPQQFVLTSVTGAGRPEQNDSHWRPYEYKRGVSGHATYGAIPFLSAASLTDHPVWHKVWLAASTVPGLSRIDTDKHYFSQVLFGWGLSWLAMRSVGDNAEAPHWIAYHDQERFMLGYRFVW